MGKKPWYATIFLDVWKHLHNRRVWATVLSLAAALSIYFGYSQVAGAISIIAGGLSLDSYTRPKRV